MMDYGLSIMMLRSQLNLGKTIGLRTDIDALSIKENGSNQKQKKGAMSKQDCILYACGHDGHMGILLTSLNCYLKMK